MKKFLALVTLCVFFARGMDLVKNQKMENLKECEGLKPRDCERATYFPYEFTENFEYSYSAKKEDDECVVHVAWFPARLKPEWYSQNPLSERVAVIIGLNCSKACYVSQLDKFVNRIAKKMKEKFPSEKTEIIWDVNPRDNSELILSNKVFLRSIGFTSPGGTLTKIY